ncbi:MAG: hypothetical protein ACKOCH_09110, partial [Bacteroidota bacterium]
IKPNRTPACLGWIFDHYKRFLLVIATLPDFYPRLFRFGAGNFENIHEIRVSLPIEARRIFGVISAVNIGKPRALGFLQSWRRFTFTP